MDRFVDSELRGELLADFPVVVATPVAWGDMDYFRHVNNIVFFRYFESARIAYLERIGFERELEESGIGPILGATDCRFRRPVTYPDVVLVGARTVELAEDRFRMEYRLVSESQRAVAAEGGGTLVAFDYRRNCKAPLPRAVRAAIEQLEPHPVRAAPHRQGAHRDS
jgi:acyl-CoA thioester hydrolase